MPNRLNQEISPYLLQHAGNPVDWQPWDETALNQAREQDKPIFLSIGYSACHWCHVMERESFEDEHIAKLLNDWFIPIKADREERPDLDNIYMKAVVAMTGQGGWPLNIILTPEGKPLFGGTYFPPTNRHGLPSFENVLQSVHSFWIEKRQSAEELAEKISAHISQGIQPAADRQVDLEKRISAAAEKLVDMYDWRYGGWGAAPKFPQPMLVDFLFLRQHRHGSADLLKAARHALDEMSRGGMYDIIGGGFHRYSTDPNWLVPHFEKMLYDNAQLAHTYLNAFLVTHENHYLEVSMSTLEFIKIELTHVEGGFFSSLDADSEGGEGRYYLWSYSELQHILGDRLERLETLYELLTINHFDDLILLRKKETGFHQVTGQPDFESSPTAVRIPDPLVAELAQTRARRVRPALDDKIIVSWNGLALKAFAEAAFYLNDSEYLQTALDNANFLLGNLIKDDVLHRVWRNGKVSSPAYLEDYAAFILGLIALHQADQQPVWIEKAVMLTEMMVDQFQDPQGGFFDTGHYHEKMLYRPKDLYDSATPSGNALASLAMQKMFQINNITSWREIAERSLVRIIDHAAAAPTGFGYWLQALDFMQGPVTQTVVMRPEGFPVTDTLQDVIRAQFRPRMIIAGASVDQIGQIEGTIELFSQKQPIGNRPTAYVCEGFVCKLPTNNPVVLKGQLNPSSRQQE